MATIDIGKIKPVFKGAYNNSTAYVLDDIVYYNGSSYVAKQSTTGNVPTNGTYWEVLASGSGGIWDANLSIGSAGQFLKVNSGASALEFTDAPQGIISSQQKINTSRSTISTTSWTNVYGTGMDIVVTPNSTSSKFFLMWSGAIYGQYLNSDIARDIGGGGYTRLSGQSNGMGGMYCNNSVWNSGCNIFLDAPNTTSQVTYRPYGKKSSSNDALFGDGSDTHIFTMLEFKG